MGMSRRDVRRVRSAATVSALVTGLAGSAGGAARRASPAIVTTLHDTLEVAYVAPGHCTGEPTFTALRKAFGARDLYAGLGTAFALGATPRPVSSAGAHSHEIMDDADRASDRTRLAASDDRAHVRAGHLCCG
jgi:hypothetical protein